MSKSLRISVVFVSIALVPFSSLASAEKTVAPAGQGNASQQMPIINATRNTINPNNIIGPLQNATNPFTKVKGINLLSHNELVH